MYTPIIITGQTATGKTSLAIRLAKHFGGEIISADSRQVFEGLNIGTGKYDKVSDLATIDEQKYISGIPIHGIDLITPEHTYNISDFCKYTFSKIEKIQSSGKVPIIVGGTGFYIKALIDPDETLSIPPNSEVRHQLEKLQKESSDEEFVKELQNQLRYLDNDKYETMNESDVQNPRRLARAIEVAIFRNSSKEAITHQKLEKYCGIGMYSEKSDLYKRIDSRVSEMLRQGYEEEVKVNANKYGWNNPGMQTIGYKEWQEYFENEKSIDEVKVKITQSHIQYARRQRIYFKKLAQFKWFNCSETTQDEIFEYCVNCAINNTIGA